MELVSPNINVNWIGKAKYFITISALMVLGSVYLWFSLGEAKYGVDFRGGSDIVVNFKEPIEGDLISQALEAGGVDSPIVQHFQGAGNEFSLRAGAMGNAKETKDKVEAALKAKFPDKYEIIRTEYIGPTIGKELRTKALVATSIALLGILFYVAFRFEFAFALGAVVALFHDVIVAMGVYLAFGFPVNMGTIAAALTIVGYSVNDTIVIFDRVREQILKSKHFDLERVLNDSLNFCFSRTIVTSLLTLFSAMALALFGGGALADLSIYLVAGIVAGSYSTIVIACPIVLYWERFRTRKTASAAA